MSTPTVKVNRQLLAMLHAMASCGGYADVTFFNRKFWPRYRDNCVRAGLMTKDDDRTWKLTPKGFVEAGFTPDGSAPNDQERDTP